MPPRPLHVITSPCLARRGRHAWHSLQSTDTHHTTATVWISTPSTICIAPPCDCLTNARSVYTFYRLRGAAQFELGRNLLRRRCSVRCWCWCHSGSRRQQHCNTVPPPATSLLQHLLFGTLIRRNVGQESSMSQCVMVLYAGRCPLALECVVLKMC